MGRVLSSGLAALALCGMCCSPSPSCTDVYIGGIYGEGGGGSGGSAGCQDAGGGGASASASASASAGDADTDAGSNPCDASVEGSK
jgi:hypothetical protein